MAEVTGRERQRERSLPAAGSCPQMATSVRAEPDRSHELSASSGPPTLRALVQACGPSSSAFPGELTGSLLVPIRAADNVGDATVQAHCFVIYLRFHNFYDHVQCHRDYKSTRRCVEHGGHSVLLLQSPDS